jgi:hypothetical protein
MTKAGKTRIKNSGLELKQRNYSEKLFVSAQKDMGE